VRPGEAPRPRDHKGLANVTGRLYRRLGIAPFSPRDTRRTFKTLAGAAGIDLEVRNRLQGHAFDDVGTRHYDRYDYLVEKRQAMERWCAYLGAILAQCDTLVPFTRQAQR
jgi:integrase